MKILIFGASGSGTTTLANSLSQKTGFSHLEVDKYYWGETNPPFQEKVKKNVRQDKLLLDFQKSKDAIVCDPLVN
jgi:adenylate kinase family enzyme